jgi:hypothetical protein
LPMHRLHVATTNADIQHRLLEGSIILKCTRTHTRRNTHRVNLRDCSAHTLFRHTNS